MNTEEQSGNKRIAKNTLFMYIRQFLIMIITLYSSRVILNNLGISDYGIYNVVGGIVVVFSFINGVMTSSTTRFISYAIGEGKHDTIDKIFSTTLVLHLALSLIVVVFCETLGMWYLNNKMQIPADRMDVARWVFHFSTLNSIFLITRVPFNSIIVANERMNVYAYLSVFEVAMRLVIALSLTVIPADKLFVYAMLMATLGVVTFFLYYAYCMSQQLVHKLRLAIDKSVANKIMTYCSWSLLSSLAGVGNTQGLNIILNYFFGTVVNAAYGISSQVLGAINSLSLGFQMALNPQITKSYAANVLDRHRFLIISSARYSCFLIVLLAYPIYFNLSPILEFWLGDYPSETISFLQYSIITAIITCVGNPFGVCIEATGKIAKFSLYTSLINICVPIVSFFLLKKTMISYHAFIVILVSTLVMQLVKLFYCYKLVELPLSDLYKQALIPILKSLIPATALCLLISRFEMNFILAAVIDVSVIAIAVYFLGITKKEQMLINKFICKITVKH